MNCKRTSSISSNEWPFWCNLRNCMSFWLWELLTFTSDQVGNSPSSPVSSWAWHGLQLVTVLLVSKYPLKRENARSSLSQPSGIFEKHPPAMATAASAPSARPVKRVTRVTDQHDITDINWYTSFTLFLITMNKNPNIIRACEDDLSWRCMRLGYSFSWWKC